MTIDHAGESRAYLSRADHWANKDSVESETRKHLVGINLKFAQVHATLAVAQELNRLPQQIRFHTHELS